MPKHNPSTPMINAKSMRIILSLGLIILLLAVGAGFYFTYKKVDDLANQTAIKQTEVDSIDRKIVYLQGLEKRLDEQSENIIKAQKIVAETKDYQYQNQIIDDLSRIASIAGVQIQNYTFQNDSATDGSNSPNVTEEADSPDKQAPSNTSQPQASINSTEVGIQLESDIVFTKYLMFISLIERNATRMQISDVSISRSEENPGLINSQEIKIKVYIR